MVYYGVEEDLSGEISMSWKDILRIVLGITVIVPLIISIIKRIKSKKKTFSKKEYEAVKKHVRIAWIENEKQTIPLKELEDDLFSIKHIKQISKNDLDALESSSYEIVILDIKDVVPKRLINRDGLGLLERIKQKSPQTYVLVCSGEVYDVEQAKILNMADDLLKKTSDYTEIKDKLEKIIKIKFFYQDELNKIYNKIRPKIPIEKQTKIFDLIEKTCSSDISKDELKSNLDSLRIAAGCVRDILKSLENILP